MEFSTRWRLSVMMLLQYMIWGAWFSYMPLYLDKLGIAPELHGWLMGMLNLAALVAPFIGGQIADRYLATEKVLAICHILGGLFIIAMSFFTTFSSLLLFMIFHSFLYIITLPLTNTLCFSNIDDVENEFGKIRVFGTIGWILSGVSLSLLFMVVDDPAFCLVLSGFYALALGIFSFFLPHTPPKRESSNPFAFLEALKLLKEPSFLIFMIISFFVSTELMFYFMLTPPFLMEIGVQESWIPSVMGIGQAAEIVTLLVLLPMWLPKFGLKKAMLIGIVAWPLRYIIMAIGQPAWLIIASLTLHGFCYVFFFVVGQIYVDRAAPPDIRNSAQSLLYFVTFGLGMFLGGIFTGYVRAFFTEGVGDAVVTNWTMVFMVPVVLTVLCAIFFVFVFHEPDEKKEPAAVS